MITTKYTGDGRLKMFNAYFGNTTVDKALMELVIPAANKSNLNNFHLFTRYDSQRDPADNVTFVESLMATTAAPTFFPSYEIQGKGIFSDGGIHLNNPAMIAYTEACRYRAPRDKIFVLSMGTGSYIPDPENPDLYRGQLFWAQNLHKIALPAQEGNTDKSMHHLLGNRYQRWQVLMEEPIALDADKKDDIDKLIDAGQQHNVFFQFKSSPNLQDLLKKYKTADNSAALRRATCQGSVDDVEFLVKMTDVNQQDKNPEKRKTALHWAITQKHYEIIILLINSGADPGIEDAQGKTPRDYADELGDSTIILMLNQIDQRERARF